MNTDYSKIVNFESEVEEVEDVVIPVTEHTFTACEGFAVESLSALLPKTDENIVDLVIGSVIKQVEAIDTLEALESFAAKFTNIRNVFNTPVKNIKELSTTMEPGTESYTAAMESELTQVAFVKNMFGIGDKDSCTVDDVKKCSDALKDINTVIQRRRYALEAFNSANEEEIATEAKKEKDDDDVPAKQGIEDDRTMKPVDDDILTKKEFALAISMAQYFQKREEKGESVPSLGKGVTWKDVAMGIHKGHYTVNALCDLGNGKIFCKGKDGKLAIIEGSDAKEMYMRAGKGIVGNDVYIVNDDTDLDENGRPKKSAMSKAQKVAKECYATAETACDGPDCEPGYREPDIDLDEYEDTYEDYMDDVESLEDILATEAILTIVDFSDDELSELNFALEALTTFDGSVEDYMDFIAEEGIGSKVREIAENIATKRQAKKTGVSLDMAKIDRAFAALQKSLDAFEYPLKSNNYTKVKKCFNIIGTIAGSILLGPGAMRLAKGISNDIALGKELRNNVKETVISERNGRKLERVSVSDRERSVRTLKERIEDLEQKKKQLINKGARLDEASDKSNTRVVYEAIDKQREKIEKEIEQIEERIYQNEDNLELVRNSAVMDTTPTGEQRGVVDDPVALAEKVGKGILAATAVIGAGVAVNTVLSKLEHRVKVNESVVKSSVEQYKDAYKEAKELVSEIEKLYKNIKKKGDPVDSVLTAEFVSKCKNTTGIIATSYERLFKMLKEIMKAAKKNKTSLTDEARIQKKLREPGKEGFEEIDFDEFEIDEFDPEITALEGFDNIQMAIYSGLIDMEDISEKDLFDVETALEAILELDLSDEELEEYLATEGVKDIANKVTAKVKGTTVDMVKVEKAYKAVEKAYKAFEHPLKAPNAVLFKRALKIILAISTAGLALTAGVAAATGTSTAITLFLEALRTTKSTKSTIDAAKDTIKSGYKDHMHKVAETTIPVAKESFEVADDDIAMEAATGVPFIDATIALLKNLKGSTYALIGTLTATGVGLIISKLKFRNKAEEEFVKTKLVHYQKVYNSVTKKFLVFKGYYEKLMKTNGNDPKVLRTFVQHANKILVEMQQEYRELNTLLTKLVKMKRAYDKAGDNRAMMDQIDAMNRESIENEKEKKKDIEEYEKGLVGESLSAESILAELEDIRDNHLFDNEWVQATEAIERLTGVLTALESYLPLTQEEEDPDKCIAALDWIETQRINVLAAIESASTFVVELDDEVAEEAIMLPHMKAKIVKEIEADKNEVDENIQKINKEIVEVRRYCYEYEDRKINELEDRVKTLKSNYSKAKDTYDAKHPERNIYVDVKRESKALYDDIHDLLNYYHLRVHGAAASATTVNNEGEPAAEAVNENHVWDINWDSLVAQITNSYNAAKSHFSGKKKSEALDSLKTAAHACSELGEHINSLTDKAFEKLNVSGSLDKFKETKRKIVTDWENKIKAKRDEIQGKKKSEDEATESFVEKAYNEYLQMLGLEPDNAMESMTSIEEDLAVAEAELDALLETSNE